MKKIIYYVLIVSSIVTGCTKPANCSGTVYSKNNIPVPNVTVQFNIYRSSSDYPTIMDQCHTDANGHYVFSKKVFRKDYIRIECDCDSGSAREGGGTWKVISGKVIDLHLK